MSIKLFDSHCHLQFPQYDADREEIIEKTLAAGCGMICVGTDLEMSKKAIELAEKYDGLPCLLRRSDRFGCEGQAPGFGQASIWATVGLHPNLSTRGVGRLGEFGELAKHPKVVAIGEVGLDHYRTKNQEVRIKQQEVFKQFLELSKDLGKPVIIHCRDAPPKFSGENLGGQAYDDLLKILNAKRPTLNAVIHSFTGNFNLAGKFLDLGLFLGFNGIITFTDKCDDMVAKVPLDKILIETDAPYLAPVPHRGKRNEPLYIEFVAKRIAEIKKISFEEVVEKTEENTKKLFKLE